MRIIKLDTTPSTNTFLKAYIRDSGNDREIAVMANEQTAGAGRREKHWHSRAGKSLTFSVFKKIPGLEAERQFYIAMAVSLGVKTALEHFGIEKTAVKWPNDIMAADRKICGILIENTLTKERISGSVIGIGLNVNDRSLPGLPYATSMLMACGKTFDIETVMMEITAALEKYFVYLSEGRFAELKQQYEACLYRKGQTTVFGESGSTFYGVIQGISEAGRLMVRRENGGGISDFGIDEVQLIMDNGQWIT